LTVHKMKSCRSKIWDRRSAKNILLPEPWLSTQKTVEKVKITMEIRSMRSENQAWIEFAHLFALIL
jgi:hypothetical protein